MNPAEIMAHQSLAPPRRPSAGEIISAVAVKHRLTVGELRSRDRTWRISHPRQEAMYELHKRTKLSLPQIARKLGLMDHTTVIHGIRAHEARISATTDKAAA